MNVFRCAATALTLVLALITGPSVAAAAPGPDAGLAAAMQRDPGIAAGQVTARQAALEAGKARLDAAARNAGPDVHAWYVDAAAGDIVILAADPAEAVAFAGAAGVDAGAVRVEPSSARPVPYADIRGGDGFMVEGKGRCIAGFTARQGGTDGFLTAGHCGEPGDVATTLDGTPIGVFAYSSGSGHDYAWVSLYAGWTPRGVVAAGGTEQPVHGAAPAPVGASVCRAAPSAGWHCGTIQQRNVTVNFPDGVVVGLVRTNVCSEPGMSGAPFVSGDQAQGITVGGSGDCTSGGTTFFQPVTEVLSALGLTLITA